MRLSELLEHDREIIEAAYNWAAARHTLLALPDKSPDFRARLNDLSEAEDALRKAVKGEQMHVQTISEPFRMPLCESGKVMLQARLYEFYVEPGCADCAKQALMSVPVEFRKAPTDGS